MISSLMRPRSVAVVGASDDTRKLRGKLLRVLMQGGFAGPVYPINPRHPEVQGLRAYRDFASLPAAAELALVAIPGAQVPAALTEAARHGARAAVVFSSDVDKQALRVIVDVTGLRVVGPNTEGMYLPAEHLAATFAGVVEQELASPRDIYPARRPIAIVSQSGGLGFALFGRARAENLDVRAVITTGNEVDLECLDFVEHLVREGQVGVILMFIEGLTRPQRFAEVAALAADRDVPIIVLKVGSSEAGQRAAVSHTAHLAGADTAYDAYFQRYGVIRVFDTEQMLAAAAALSRLPTIAQIDAAIVTTSGGAGAWAADACAAAGVGIPAFSAKLQEHIGRLIPAFGSASNPIDVTAQVLEDGGRSLVRVIDTLVDSTEVASIIVNMGLTSTARIDGMRSELEPLLAQMAKPILFHSHVLPAPDAQRALSSIGGHAFPSFRAAAFALTVLHQRSEFLSRWEASAERPARSATRNLPPEIAGAPAGVLDERATARLLQAFDVPTPPGAIVASKSAALDAARSIGFPVALKVISPDIPHKTEAGAVMLDVDEAALAGAYDAVLANARRNVRDARIEGVLVQKMMPPGHELVVGVVNDVDFGPLVMLGLGGIYVEILKDVTFAPAPLDSDEARRMIARLKSAPILRGARGRPPADVDALVGLLVGVSEAAAAGDSVIDQLDLNPVFVYDAGKGVVAVDALASVKGPVKAR